MYPRYLTGRHLAEMERAAQAQRELASAKGDSHLRRTKEVIGNSIHATDGDIGQVSGFLVDDRAWAIRYLLVDTSSWWIGNKVLVAPHWIARISWPDRHLSCSPKIDDGWGSDYR